MTGWRSPRAHSTTGCAKLGISRFRHLDALGNIHRQVYRIVTERPGQPIHVDVEKIGAIPTGGGWRVHGRGITIERVLIKNGSCDRSAMVDAALPDDPRHRFTRPNWP